VCVIAITAVYALILAVPLLAPSRLMDTLMGRSPRLLSQPTKSDRCCLKLGHPTTQLFQSCRESWVFGNHYLLTDGIG
jgi:hypothetical protein